MKPYFSSPALNIGFESYPEKMIGKITFIIIVYLGLVHGVPRAIHSPRKPDYAKASTLIHRAKRGQPSLPPYVYGFQAAGFTENNCPSGQVWDTYQRSCKNGVSVYSNSGSNDAFDYDDDNDQQK